MGLSEFLITFATKIQKSMKRILFCELCPFTYRLSMEKEILKRHLRDFFGKTLFASISTNRSFAADLAM